MMKNAFVFLFIFNCLANSLFCQTIDLKEIDSFLTAVETQNRDIGAVSIFKDGKEIYARSFNQKAIGNETTNENLKYQIGSITKMLTATMIFQLIEEDKLALDDTLAYYFPNIPNAEEITIKHLLNHSSGLGDYVVKQDTLYYWLADPVTEKQIFDEIKRQGILFQPGDSVSYSNTGYYLLTKILEAERGKSYKEIFAENIVGKLDLKSTYSIAKGNKDSTIAKSFEFTENDSLWKEIEEFYFPNVIGVGDVVSTPTELNSMIHALFSGKLISKESLNKMKPTKEQHFGKGLMHIPFYDMTFYGHGGDTFGTHSLVAIKDDFSISYTINGEYYPTNEFAIDILSIIFDKEVKPHKNSNYEADPTTYYQYVGTYSDNDFPLKLEIFKVGNLLKAQATGQSAFILTPFAENRFFFEKAGIEIEFLPKKNKLILKQGREFVLSKKE